MKHYIFIWFVALLLASCEQSVKQDNVQTLNFNCENSDDISDMIKVNFIKLETNDSCLINGTIQQVESALGKFFILTGGMGNQLLVFDTIGKFVTTVGSRGSGPQEYLFCSSFSIDHSQNIISVVDMAQQKVIHYSLINYKFILEQRIAEGLTCFEYLENNKIVWHNFIAQGNLANWSFVVTDINQKHVGEHVKKDFLTGYHTAPLKSMCKTDGSIFAYTDYHPIVYQFRGDSIYPLYKLEFGNFQYPPLEHLKKISVGRVNFLGELAQSDFVYTFSVFGIDNLVAVDYMVSNTHYIGLYNKQNNQTYSYEMEKFQKKLKIGKIDRIFGVANNSIVLGMSPFHLLEEKGDYPTELQQLLDKSNEDDNPILCLFNLRSSSPEVVK